MTVPTAPYATTAQVAMFVPALIAGASDFSGSTMPPKTTVAQMASWISAQIDMQFRAAGYKVPFVVMTGETWLDSQTNYLALLTCLGTASFVSGHVLKPAPAVAPGREGAASNIFQRLFDQQLALIYNPGLRTSLVGFRADFYAGTAAEYAMTQPSGPTSDFMEGMFDPTRYGTLAALTDLQQRVDNEIATLELEWDYLYTYQDYNAGLGGVD